MELTAEQSRVILAALSRYETFWEARAQTKMDQLGGEDPRVQKCLDRAWTAHDLQARLKVELA